VRDLLLNRSDVHHVYPRNHLKKQGMARGRYNQIANFVLAQSEINIGIGDRAPEVYFAELADQCNGGAKKYGRHHGNGRDAGQSPHELSARSAARWRHSRFWRLPRSAPNADGGQDQDLLRGALRWTRLKPYPFYKDSGKLWLGCVPKHWDVRRNGRLFAERVETGFEELPILEVSLRTGVRVRDMENGGRKQQMTDRSKYKRRSQRRRCLQHDAHVAGRGGGLRLWMA